MKIRSILGASILLFGSVANAAIVNEFDVAPGDKPSTSPIHYGDEPMTQIDGYLSKHGRRVDMYGIHLSTTELFAAHATITVGSNPGEMSVLLFDDQGIGIAAIWRFGTAQIGLAGISKRRQTV